MATIEKDKKKTKQKKKIPDLKFSLGSHADNISKPLENKISSEHPNKEKPISVKPNKDEIIHQPVNVLNEEIDHKNKEESTSSINNVSAISDDLNLKLTETDNKSEPVIVINIPSAPIIHNDKIKCFQHSSNQLYPNLQTSEINKTKSYEKKQTLNDQKKIFKPNPLTKNQLNQLYDCKMLEIVKQFELEFLTTSLKTNFENDPLHNLLQNYAISRSKIKINLIDFGKLQIDFEKCKNNIWKIESKTVEGKNMCKDNVWVFSKESYESIFIDQTYFNNLDVNLNKMFELIICTYNQNRIKAETARLKIEQIIREILSLPCFAKIDLNSEVKLLIETNAMTVQCLQHLRRALSILFAWYRKPAPDKIFSNDIVEWISTLGAVYLRVATSHDHWFLLFHILRCPSGISVWATKFIQMPEPKIPVCFDLTECQEINHCLSILNILLLPIKKRNEFLYALVNSHREISDPVSDDVWIIVDSDGEEGSDMKGECTGLRESDLISVLNQVPLEMVFRCAINAEKNDGDYNIEIDHITAKQFLQLIAFLTKLVEIFGNGLLTYNKERYKQFAKRLGRLIRHTIHFATDMHALFLQNNISKEPLICEQITVQINSFIMKACSYIYKTPNLATWQYFSSLPFASLEIDTLWQLFIYLNIGFPDEFPIPDEDFKKLLDDPNFWIKFNLATVDLSSEDLYYLIQTFFEMANERDRMKDGDFIEAICVHIFLIGYVNESSKEICYKTSRDMLTNLTLSNPELISILLKQMKNRFQETENLIYLTKSLPMENWKTDIQSFEILSNWLLNYNYDFKENGLARNIISHLNWSFDIDGRLFLPHNIHVRMACLICEALSKHNPEVLGSSTISESMRQFTNFIENHSNKEQFTTWCWNMIALLRLHLMDQNIEAIKKTLANPSDHLCFVPDLENFSIVYQEVKENQPLALYISILISLYGHSIPLICQKAIPQMILLLSDHRYTCIIRCIQLITPLFLETPDTLANCENFQCVIKELLNADRTYMKIAKELIGTNSQGPVFKHFLNMIQSQVIHYYEIGLTTPSLFIHLWLEILLSIQNWSNTNIVFIIDAILKIAYQFSDSWGNCKEFFREYYKNYSDWKTERSSALKILLGSGNQHKNFPILSTDCGWLSLLLLELEHETQEKSNFLWSELLQNLQKNNEKNIDTVNNILKKSCSAVGYPQFSFSSLVLFKYANLIVNADINHPLLPIFGQNFFLLYLCRVNTSQENERFNCNFAVSDVFYEYNIPLMKKMKTKLKIAEENYAKESQSNADNEVLSYFFSQCSKIMKTYLIWLEETDLQKISKHQRIDLPLQYNSSKLVDIFNGNALHWTEFIYLRKIRDEQKNASNLWLKFCFRYHKIKHQCGDFLKSNHSISPVERIKIHLKSYEKPLDPPKVNKKPLIFYPLKPNSINSHILEELRKELKYIEKFSRNISLKSEEISSLDTIFKDQSKHLYKNVPYLKTVSQECSNLSRFNKTCTGCATIQLKLSRPQKIESVQRKLDENREKYENNVESILSQDFNEIVYSIQNIEHIIKYIIIAQEEVTQEPSSSKIQIARVAIDFFYDILKFYKNNHQPIEAINDYFSSVIRDLGVFILNNQESESFRILDLSLKKPNLLDILSEHFIPTRTTPKKFVSLYKFLIEAHNVNQDSNTIFVLLSKFDLLTWLKDQQVDSAEIIELMDSIFLGLENWNKPESSIIQDLFRRHLIHIFKFNFPSNYFKILQKILDAISNQKICTIVLLDLINTLLKLFDCGNITLESSKNDIEKEAVNFANLQNILDFRSIIETLNLFSQHFYCQRFQNGLHGLYPKHKNYCFTLSIWFTILSRTLITAAISTFPGVLGSEVCDSVFAPMISLYSPWIAIYKKNDLEFADFDWLKQYIKNNNKILPWSETYLECAELMINSYIDSLQYMLKNLPEHNKTLGHIYCWYQYHFVDQELSDAFIQIPIHKALENLPWECFTPDLKHIELFYKTFSEADKECKNFLAHIFVMVQWSTWSKEEFYTWDLDKQRFVINLLFPVFIKISFKSIIINKHKTAQTDILEESLKLPWYMIEINNIESVWNWLFMTVNPTLFLNITSKKSSINIVILKLLKLACMMTKISNFNNLKFEIWSKRVLYVRNVVRLLHTFSNNNDKLLANAENLICYQNIIFELLNNLEDVLLDENSQQERELEGQNLILEIIGSLQNKSQSSSKPFVDAIIYWQSTRNPRNIAISIILNSYGLCKVFVFNMYPLLEATLCNYFRFCTTDAEDASWKSVFIKLSDSISHFDLQILLKESYYLILHAYIIFKIRNFESLGEKINLLQDISQCLENSKPNVENESRLIIVWGAVISCGVKLLKQTEHVKKTLLMIARQLYILAKQSEGWSDSLLGAIGLRRESGLLRRKLLFRCFSTVVFSLFPNESGMQSQEYQTSLNELIDEYNNKSIANLKNELSKAIEIIKKVKISEPEFTTECICNLISIFYNDCFIKNAKDVWTIT